MQAQDPGAYAPPTHSAQADAYVAADGVCVSSVLGDSRTMLIAMLAVVSSPIRTLRVRGVVRWSSGMLALALRYVDITRDQGQTPGGDPASTSDCRRCLVGLTAMAAAYRVAAHTVNLR